MRRFELLESEVFVDRHGVARDDEGNRWQSGARSGVYRGRDIPGPRPDQSWKNRSERESAQVRAISKAFTENPQNSFLRGVFRLTGKTPLRLSDKQREALRRTLHKMKMHKEAKLFEENESMKTMNSVLERLEGLSEGMGSSSVMDPASTMEVNAWKKRADKGAKDAADKVEATLMHDMDGVKRVRLSLDKKESEATERLYSVKVDGRAIGWVQFSFPNSGHSDWTFHSKDGSAMFDRFSDRYGAIKRAAQRFAKIRGRM